jgi:HK97 family phage major capsid protein
VGYRYVKNLLIKISDEEKTALSTLNETLADKQSSLEATTTAIAELPEDATTDTDEQKKSREELTAQADTLNAEIAELNTQISTLTETAFSAIQPKVDEVLAKIAANENFDALIAAYGEDPGMQTEPQKSTGYLVCDGLTTYVTEFLDASMALQSVGDISDTFRSSVGVHIVQYASDLPNGQVPLADIHDQVSAALLQSKQNTLYDETANQWVADANAKTYLNKLTD